MILDIQFEIQNDKEKVNQTENRFEKYNKNIFTCKIIIFTNFSP